MKDVYPAKLFNTATSQRGEVVGTITTEIANPADQPPDPEDCLAAAVAGTPQISLVNLTVATFMCNAGMRVLMEYSMFDEIVMDCLDAHVGPVWLTGDEYGVDEQTPAGEPVGAE